MYVTKSLNLVRKPLFFKFTTSQLMRQRSKEVQHHLFLPWVNGTPCAWSNNSICTLGLCQQLGLHSPPCPWATSTHRWWMDNDGSFPISFFSLCCGFYIVDGCRMPIKTLSAMATLITSLCWLSMLASSNVMMLCSSLLWSRSSLHYIIPNQRLLVLRHHG